jgi:hypothetical protein
MIILAIYYAVFLITIQEQLSFFIEPCMKDRAREKRVILIFCLKSKLLAEFLNKI